MAEPSQSWNKQAKAKSQDAVSIRWWWPEKTFWAGGESVFSDWEDVTSFGRAFQGKCWTNPWIQTIGSRSCTNRSDSRTLCHLQTYTCSKHTQTTHLLTATFQEKPWLAGCHLDSQFPVILILSILAGQASTLHTYIILITLLLDNCSKTYINFHYQLLLFFLYHPQLRFPNCILKFNTWDVILLHTHAR